MPRCWPRADLQALPPPAIKRQVEGIVKGADRLRTIVEDIIDVSLIDTEVLALNLEMTSLFNMIELARADLVEAATERQQILNIDDFGGLSYIEADALRLYQVFGNILGNAVKYTPDGGRIDILARHLETKTASPPLSRS